MLCVLSSHLLYSTVLTLLLYTLFSAIFTVLSHIPASLLYKNYISPCSTYIQTLLLRCILETIPHLGYILSCNTPFIQNILLTIPHLLYTTISLLYYTCMHLILFLFLLLLLFIVLYYIHNLIHPILITYLSFPICRPFFILFFYYFLLKIINNY